MNIENEVAKAKIQKFHFDKQSCNEALKSSGVSTSLLFQQANSNWRCRPARPKTEPRHISYDDLPDLADIDPALLASRHRISAARPSMLCLAASACSY
jgi:hypothetical protein